MVGFEYSVSRTQTTLQREVVLNYSSNNTTSPRLARLLVLLGLLLPPCVSLAQEQNPSVARPQPQTESAAPGAQSSEPVVPRPQLVAQAEEVTRLLLEIKTRLDSQPGRSQVIHDVQSLEVQINRARQELNETIASDPGLSDMGSLEREWQTLSHYCARLRSSLAERAKTLKMILSASMPRTHVGRQPSRPSTLMELSRKSSTGCDKISWNSSQPGTRSKDK